MGFGYLNLGDPASIGDNESQIAINCRVDRGCIEYASWAVTDNTRNRRFTSSSGTYYIDATFPDTGKIMRGSGETPGLPSPSITGVGVTIVASTGNPYPPGTYYWVFTYYDQTTGEEGPPSSPIYQVIGTNQIGKIETLPSISKTGHTLKINLYRLPLGGSEYLFAKQCAVGDASITDDVADSSLGGALLTDGYQRATHDGSLAAARHIAIFNGKMFFAYYSLLGFTVTEDIAFTKAEFVFDFSEGIDDLIACNEVLYIFTQTKTFVLYGNDESDFVLKEVNQSVGACMGAAGLVNNDPIIGATKKYSVTVAGTASDVSFVDSIQVATGSALKVLSNKIKSLFPLSNFYYGSSGQSFETGVFDDRFWVLKHSKLTTYTFADLASYLAQLDNPYYLVYDTNGDGFLQGDPAASTFTYRSKEFGSAGKVEQVRTAFVEAVGTFTVTIYGDNVALTAITMTLSTRQNVQFRVMPIRCHRFSFHFSGNSDAKIYDFGRIE